MGGCIKSTFKIVGYLFIGLIVLVVLVNVFGGNSNPSTRTQTAGQPASQRATFTPTPNDQASPGLPTATPEPPTPTPNPDEIKAMASEVEYKDLHRNVEQYIGQMIHFEGEIIQSVERTVLFGDNYRIFRIRLDDSNIIWTEYHDQERYLETDQVAVWGTVNGLEKYQSVLGGTIELPSVTVRLIELLAE